MKRFFYFYHNISAFLNSLKNINNGKTISVKTQVRNSFRVLRIFFDNGFRAASIQVTQQVGNRKGGKTKYGYMAET